VSLGARYAALAALALCGAALVVLLYQARIRTPLESTLTTSFQILGVPLKLGDRLASRVLPVNELDERELGEVYRAKYDGQIKSGDRAQAYLDGVVAELWPLTRKPFRYRAYVVGYSEPNAMALPGGVILVTRALLQTLHSESELVAVLAHEMGHIERGHCFDAVRFELLARKLGVQPLGSLADLATQLLLRHSYSKTMEHEADDYAFTLLVDTLYDPRGEGAAFRSMQAWLAQRGRATPQHASPLRDYFASHPPLEIRAEEYGERANAWWRAHADERRYVGVENLRMLQALAGFEMTAEWTIGP